MMMLRLEGAALTSKGSWTLEDSRLGDVHFIWVTRSHVNCSMLINSQS